MRVLKITAALALTVGLVLGPAGTTQAAPPGNGYDYTDPAQTGCSATGITIWSKELRHPATGAVNGVMELRYSTACETNWVRVNNYVNGAAARKIIVRPRVHAPAGGSLEYAEDSTVDVYHGWSYGLQVYAPSWVCVDVGAVLIDGTAVIGSNGQALDRVC
ncbi:hypothetical protein GAR05_03560 [Micromonospora saelicesensis]|uniref:DUF2690 domain-containing protein n=1 Tax=Micromonospora saelicesensis TaxID=285676 RepID=A0ABX9CHI0_9ACTN|nr:DUF2690 domain-containing protein [Micromonospora saelicesensis]RAN97440.1 hypothetical protein GAR05_03560 [Micromonospora saelicesensis]